MKLSRSITFALPLLLTGAFVLLSGCGALNEALAEAEAAKELEIRTPDLSAVSDGTYRGAYDAGLTGAEVEARVADGRIEALELLQHDNGRGEPAEVLTDRIVERQSLELDVVSGATISSKIILKASELAIRKGLKKPK
jgi:uncharacterized protein with FMN-binding domain